MSEDTAKISQTSDRRPQTPSLDPFIARLRTKIRKYPLIHYPLRFIKRTIINIWSFIKWQVYKHTVKFNRNGLNTTEQRPRKIIVSVTSYPARINVVPYVIASFLQQTLKPDKIILWLGEDRFPNGKLPKVFDKLKACGVEVKFRQDLRAHTKYFYAVREYPEDIVITFDDDFVYSKSIVETLYKSYLQHPACVSSMRTHKLTLDADGNLKPYTCSEIEYKDHAGDESHRYFATGVGGVLYPPHSLHPEVFNIEAMKRLSYLGDDIWLKFMEVMNNTRVVPASNESNIQGWMVSGSQKYALWKTNVAGRQNDVQYQAIVEAYADWRDSQGRTITEIIREG